MPTPPDDDTDFDSLAAARKAARRKAYAILFGVFALLFALFAYAFIADEEPPDTSDLRVVFMHPPEDQNAYALLAKLVATLPPEPKENTPEERHFARIFSKDSEDQVAWDQTIVASVLSRYPSDLSESVLFALNAPESEVPELKSFSDTMPEVGQFRHLSSIFTQQAALAWNSGDHMAAADLNLLTLQLGNRISQSRGYIITVLVGAGIQGMAMDSIRRHTDTPAISALALRRYIMQLPEREISISDYHHAYKLEHTGTASILLSSFNGDFSLLTGSPHAAIASLAVAPGIYQPNRTIRWHADFTRANIANSEPTTPDAADHAADQLKAIIEAPWPRRAENFTGRKLLDLVVPTLSHLTVNGHRVRANLRLTQIYVALRLYQLEHDNTLPAALAELVPAYLPAVPLDPFGGQPLRYDRALTTIWSIDRDHLTITEADGDFPESGMPAHRLRFARPTVKLPTFEENPAQQDTEPGLLGNP